MKANKEVIVSAGGLGSPQLLMLSGIGPKEHLKSVGIPCKKDLPVGEGLQDHLLAYVGPILYDHSKTQNAHQDPDLNLNTLHEYITKRSGEKERHFVLYA